MLCLRGVIKAIRKMKYLIIGLGNIGSEYAHTRHNIGFDVVDALAGEAGAQWEVKRYASVARCRVKSAELVLIKPSTYMNLSGEAVRYWMSQESIPMERILVVVDDLALPFGALRLKGKGSDAGHNGLKNIALLLKSEGYARLRFGIGNDYPQGRQVDYVLGQFSAEEQAAIGEHIKRSVEAIKSFALQGIARTMNLYNTK